MANPGPASQPRGIYAQRMGASFDDFDVMAYGIRKRTMESIALEGPR